MSNDEYRYQSLKMKMRRYGFNSLNDAEQREFELLASVRVAAIMEKRRSEVSTKVCGVPDGNH